jgi:hypothetical protein
MLDKSDFPLHRMGRASITTLRPMDFIAGAKILAERFGDTEPVGVDQAGDARPLFQWCGSALPGIADGATGVEPEGDAQ